MSHYSNLIDRLRTVTVKSVPPPHGISSIATDHILNNPDGPAAADAIEKLEEIIIELKHKQAKRIEELEALRKKELDFYLWDKKRLSRRIASLQYWMKKLFKYGSSPDAIRNQMTMATEIPDWLMREGEDILLETSTRALEEEE